MAKYLQVHFKGNEKLELARIAVEMRANMTEIVRLALVEFLIKYKTKQLSAETNADDSSASQVADTPAQPQELPTSPESA